MCLCVCVCVCLYTHGIPERAWQMLIQVLRVCAGVYVCGLVCVSVSMSVSVTVCVVWV